MESSSWGGARDGAGRKKGSLGKGEKHTGRLVIVCLESEEAEIKRLAKQEGKNVSRFVLDKVFQE